MGYNSSQKAITQTLIYSDIFNYPLTKEELWNYAIEVKMPLQKNFFLAELQKPSQLYISHQGYYVLKDRKQLVSLRLKRQRISEQKLSIAKKVSKLLSRIPTIRFIGVTGSLSMLNTHVDDDIDFFIITRHKTMWITRLLVILLLQCIGRRRKRGETKARDKICVNLLIDESVLALPQTYRDVYTAHEVIQINPLFDRNDTYEKFIIVNDWVKTFLPNALEAAKFQGSKASEHSNNFVTLMLCSFAALVNPIAKPIQLWYMKKHHTSEIITDTMLAFYEGSTRKRVLERYEKKLRQYEL